MGSGGKLVQKPSVDSLGKKRAPFIGISQDHIDHFIIARVTQRFVVSPVSERRTQEQRMQLLPGKMNVHSTHVLLQILANFFKAFMQSVNRPNCRRPKLFDYLALALAAFAGWR